MKNKKVVLVLCLTLVLGLSFVSAGLFSDFFDKILFSPDNSIISEVSIELSPHSTIFGIGEDIVFDVTFRNHQKQSKNFYAWYAIWDEKNELVYLSQRYGKIYLKVLENKTYNNVSLKIPKDDNYVGRYRLEAGFGSSLHSLFRRTYVSFFVRNDTGSCNLGIIDESLKEVCDGKDNDFDGLIDEDFDLDCDGHVDEEFCKGNEVSIIDNSNWQKTPVIYEDKIVYQDNRNGNYDIYMYDIITEIETQITSNLLHQSNPAIYEDKIVWEDRRNGDSDIYMYDLDTQLEKRITIDLAYQTSPFIYEDKIVYQDNRNGNYDIYMYDLDTKKEVLLETEDSDKFYLSMYKDKIVWLGSIGGNNDIYMYDLAKGEERRVTTNTFYQGAPAIYENKIVWEDRRSGNFDIYLIDVDDIVDWKLDCDDSDEFVYFGLSEFCDGIDNNCDGKIDLVKGASLIYYESVCFYGDWVSFIDPIIYYEPSKSVIVNYSYLKNKSNYLKSPQEFFVNVNKAYDKYEELVGHEPDNLLYGNYQVIEIRDISDAGWAGNPTILDPDYIGYEEDPGFAVLHEMGHDFTNSEALNNMYVGACSCELWASFLAFYIYDIGLFPLKYSNFDRAYYDAAKNKYTLNKSEALANADGDAFIGILLELKDKYGWDMLKIFFKKYHHKPLESGTYEERQKYFVKSLADSAKEITGSQVDYDYVVNMWVEWGFPRP
jgi:beta propeller repeat protein